MSSNVSERLLTKKAFFRFGSIFVIYPIINNVRSRCNAAFMGSGPQWENFPKETLINRRILALKFTL